MGHTTGQFLLLVEHISKSASTVSAVLPRSESPASSSAWRAAQRASTRQTTGGQQHQAIHWNRSGQQTARTMSDFWASPLTETVSSHRVSTGSRVPGETCSTTCSPFPWPDVGAGNGGCFSAWNSPRNGETIHHNVLDDIHLIRQIENFCELNLWSEKTC